MSSTTDTIESIINQARTLLPGNAFTREIESGFRAVLQSQLHKLGGVSQDEFDAQVEVLRRSREKIDTLERQLDELLQQQR